MIDTTLARVLSFDGGCRGRWGGVRPWPFLSLFTLALVAHAGEPAPEARPLALAEAYRLAVAHDARIAAASAARAAGLERLPQGRALLLPALSLGAETAWNDLEVSFHESGPLFASGTRRYNSNRYGVTLAQPLYHKPSLAQYRQAKVVAAQAETEYAVARQDLILRLAQAYFDVLLAHDTLRYLDAQQVAIAALRDRARRAFEAGTAAITEVREAEARADLVRAQLLGATSELEIRREALGKLTGVPARALAGLRTQLEFAPPQPADPEHWAVQAEQSSLTAGLARQAVDISHQEFERRRGTRYPTLDLAGSYTEASEDDSLFGVGFDTSTRRIGVQVQLPLYAGGALSSQQREAEARLEQARQQEDETRRQARLDARATFLRLTTGLAQVRAFEQAIASSETALGATERGLAAGTRTALDVLNAQQQLYGALRDLAQARYGVILTGLRLKAVVGQLGVEDIAAVDRLFEMS